VAVSSNVTLAVRLQVPLLSIGRRVRFRHVRRTLRQVPPPAAVLDAGCGDGRLAHSLATRYPAASVVAIDSDANVVDANRRRHSDSITWEVGEIGSAPLPGAQFDLVVCVDVLEHVRDDGAGLLWLAQQLALGGTLVLHVPAAGQRHIRSVGAALREEVSMGEGPHVREGYAPHDLRRLLVGAGLDVQSVTSTFHCAVVRGAVDCETWMYLRRARWLKALMLPVLLAAGAVERRSSTHRNGNGCLAVARRLEVAPR